MTNAPEVIEYLDVLDDLGRVVGTKPRHDVHRDGDWHQVFHCQIVSIRNGVPTALLQQRSHAKAAFPGLLDVSAAGHLTAGETPMDGLRELEEELGIRPNTADLTVLGVRRLVDESGEGRLNKELTHVYMLRDDRPLGDYIIQQAEVDAVFDLPIDEALRILGDPSAKMRVGGVAAAGSEAANPVQRTISASDLVPGTDYWVTLMVMAKRFLAGHKPLAI